MPAIRTGFASPAEDGVWTRGAARQFAAVLVLTIVALLSRNVGLAFLLPERMEGDGGVLVRQVELLDEHADAAQRDADACWGYYPHVVARVASALTRAPAAAPGSDASVPDEHAPLGEHLAAASAQHVRVRGVVSWIAALLVPGTWFLARRFLAPGAALLACAFVVVSPLVLVVAQEARPHAPAAVFALLAVLAALRLRSTPTLVAYAVAGGAAALAIGTLQSGVAVLLPLAVAHVLREKRAGASWRELAGAALALALVALAFVFLYPHAAAPGSGEGGAELGARDDGNYQFYGHTVFFDRFDGSGFVSVARVFASFDVLLAVLAVAGAIAWCAEARVRTPSDTRFGSRDLLVVLAYALPYLVVIGAYGRTYERFVVQLVPFAACAAAFVLARIATRARGLAVALGVCALALPAWTSAGTLALRAGPSTADWMAETIAHDHPRETIACVPFVDLPLARTDAALVLLQKIGWQSPWMGYQRTHSLRLPAEPRYDLRTLPLGRKKVRDQIVADPLAYLRSTGATHFVVSLNSVRASDDASFAVLRAALARAGKLVAARGGAEDGAMLDPLGVLPLDATDSSAWRWRNWTLAILTGDARAGFALELWRLE